MDTYFYCSYEHSRLGFFPSCIRGDALVPADGTGGTALPDVVSEFFSYDRFRILWRDYPVPGSQALFPEADSGMLGLRGLEGRIGNRKAVVNFAMTADRAELEQLKKTALSVIGDYFGFSAKLFQWMSLGGACGYELDTEAFGRWQQEIMEGRDTALPVPEESMAGKMLRYLQKPGGRNRTERDLLHFAVCTDEWKFVAPYMGNRVIWALKPKEALTWEEFTEQFLSGKPS